MKAVLITGANSGIGYYSSRRLAASGFYVYAGIRKESNLNRFDGLDNIQPIKLDVTSQDDIDAAVRIIEDRGLFGIVNNAGIQRFSAMNHIAESELRELFDTNVFGPCRINKAFAPMLIESKGRTVTIGSVSGYTASVGTAAYSMTKFALEGYTDAYAKEMEEYGVHVCIIEPGGYNTNILRNADNDSLPAEIRAGLHKKLSQFARTGKDPHEVSEAVLHMMTDTIPKRRRMVVPNANQAHRTIQSALEKVVELSHNQKDDNELIMMLEQLLAESSSE